MTLGHRQHQEESCHQSSNSRWRFKIFIFFWISTLFAEGTVFWINLNIGSPLLTIPLRVAFVNDQAVVRDFDSSFLPCLKKVQKGDQLAAFYDVRGRRFPIRVVGDRFPAFSGIAFNEPFRIELLRNKPDKSVERYFVDVEPIAKPKEFDSFFFGNYLSTLPFFVINFLAATFIGFSRPRDRAALNAAFLFLSFCSLQWADRFAFLSTGFREFGYTIWLILFSCMSAFFLRFFLDFPSPSSLARRLPWLKHAALGFGVLFAAWNYNWHYSLTFFTAFNQRYIQPLFFVDVVLDLAFALLVVLGIVSLFLNIRQTNSPGERRRLIVLCACCAVGLLPWVTYFITQVVFNIPLRIPGVDLVFSALRVLFPLFFAWAVIKHRLFGIRVIIRKGLQFALLSRGFLFLEGMLVFLGLYYAFGPAFIRAFGVEQQGFLVVATAGVTLAALMGISRMNRGFMHFLERKYFRETHDARRVLTEFGFSVRRHCMEADRLADLLLETVSRTLHPTRAAVFYRVREWLNLPSDSEVMKQLRRFAGSLPETSYIAVSAFDHAEKLREKPQCPMNPMLTVGRESRILRLLRLKGAEKGRPVEVPVRTRTAAEYDHGFPPELGDRFITDSRVCLVIPFTSGEAMTGFLCLGEKMSEEPYASEEVEFLQAVAQQTTATLEHAALILQSREQSQLLREMEIARQVQSTLFPTVTLPTPGLDYAGVCRPARYVGGDYFDFIRVGTDELAIAVGDITGKGVSAALLMAGLQATLRMQVDAKGKVPGQILTEINQRFFAAGEDRRFATLFLGMYEPASRTLHYASAGHNPPMLFRASANGSGPEALEATGMLLGVLQDAVFEAPTVQLDPGDLLVIYSDGITEAMNEAWELYGEERFQSFLMARKGMAPKALVEEVLAELRRFTGDAPQSDDITLVIARVGGAA